MPRERFTVTKLRKGVDELNDWMAAAGAPTRFLVGARNGYQTVDEYPVDAAGKRIGSGVNRMVGSGSSREAYQEAFSAYREIIRQTEAKRFSAS